MRYLWALVLSGSLVSAAAQGRDDGAAPSFERLRSLVGDWVAETENGETIHTSYRLVANGTAVLESLNDATHQDMTTIYHPDGEALVATHYCSSDNQPRMRATPPDAGESSLVFETVAVTNLASPRARHIRRIRFRFEDDDHFSQEWTQREDGKETVDVLHFVRKR